MVQPNTELRPRRPKVWQYLWKDPDTKRKILVTLGLIAVFRLLLHIPLPGIATTPDTIQDNLPTGSGLYTLIDFLSILSGSSLLRVSILGLGLLPYNLASVQLQIFVPLIPPLQRRLEENPYSARKLMEKWNYFLAFPLAILESFLFLYLISPNCDGRFYLLEGTDGHLNILLTATTVLVLAAGSYFSVWIAELISEFGIRGQGNAILILTGIIGRFPEEITRVLGFQSEEDAILAGDSLIGQFFRHITTYFDSPEKYIPVILYALVMFGCLVTAIYVLQGRRNIPVMYPGRRVGNRMAMPIKGSIPLSTSIGKDGLIGSQLVVAMATFFAPLISCTTVPWLNGLALSVINIFDSNSPWFSMVVFPLVVIFSFFYADITFQQQNYAENLKRAGASIAGVMRGGSTNAYLRKVARRITMPAAIMLGFLAIAPSILSMVISPTASIQFSILDGEILLIVVSVIRDIFLNIDAEMKMHGFYDRLLI
ncbi:MAG: preprotein translocase subunit SecY [Chloroflexota bacterium]